MKIMISYRRSDTGPITGRIYDRLRAHFGADHVFIDIDSIPMGTDYRRHIDKSMKRCDVLLPVIGPRWTGSSEGGKRRIDDPSDLVRLEVAHALERDIRVIPLLVENAHLPATSELPDDLKSLRFRNALRVDSGIDFHHHIDRLCAAIEAAAKETGARPTGEHREEPPPSVLTTTSLSQPPDPGVGVPVIIPAPPVGEQFPTSAESTLPKVRSLVSQLTETKWYPVILGVVGILLVAMAVLRFVPRHSSSTKVKDDISAKIARVPDSRHFPAGSIGAQLVGRWKQGDLEFLFFEDGTFSTESPTKGGDDGRWELSGRHIIATGTSHPRRKWMLTLSLDGAVLTGRMADDQSNNDPVTLRRQ